jgi:hypothetical protein
MPCQMESRYLVGFGSVLGQGGEPFQDVQISLLTNHRTLIFYHASQLREVECIGGTYGPFNASVWVLKWFVSSAFW